ncbi:hypothetical protein DCAR_0625212 [Daucus carota subsp. sativus]|uniref:Uncharacterized protein n=1 Tax=Daucus carota subsp. sativus TaxID=79200 RepID=A0A164WAF0_DAUCS|nr:hypothetical protein DCAR_0625212 [Daucus carota subsp. sativus]
MPGFPMYAELILQQRQGSPKAIHLDDIKENPRKRPQKNGETLVLVHQTHNIPPCRAPSNIYSW